MIICKSGENGSELRLHPILLNSKPVLLAFVGHIFINKTLNNMVTLRNCQKHKRETEDNIL
jgi:hypothetical protein